MHSLTHARVRLHRCNVMHCRNCDIFWNWRTAETGRSSHELKERARQRQTLWEVQPLLTHALGRAGVLCVLCVRGARTLLR